MTELIKALFDYLGKNKKLAIALVLAAYTVAQAVGTVTGAILTALGVPH